MSELSGIENAGAGLPAHCRFTALGSPFLTIAALNGRVLQVVLRRTGSVDRSRLVMLQDAIASLDVVRGVKPPPLVVPLSALHMGPSCARRSHRAGARAAWNAFD
jgi:hypothetical protein